MEGKPVRWWTIMLSHADLESWYLHNDGTSWPDVLAHLESWDVDWAPEDVNDQALFRLFPDIGQDTYPEWRDRRRRVWESKSALEPTIPGSQDVRSPKSAPALQKMIFRILSQQRQLQWQQGLAHLGQRDRTKLEAGDLNELTSVSDALWEAGYELAIIPLDATAHLGPIQDPWKTFR
ncbi:hypothetical protein [Microbacterium sp.]|uniref:hypothetical protein n=1 Tax=Microbacterium sp. TaxID=51671 RepID=UPI003A8DD770